MPIDPASVRWDDAQFSKIDPASVKWDSDLPQLLPGGVTMDSVWQGLGDLVAAAKGAFESDLPPVPQWTPADTAQAAFREVAAKATPADLANPAFGQRIATEAAQAQGLAPELALPQPSAPEPFRLAGPGAAADAYMRGAVSPLSRVGVALPAALGGLLTANRKDDAMTRVGDALLGASRHVAQLSRENDAAASRENGLAAGLGGLVGMAPYLLGGGAGLPAMVGANTLAAGVDAVDAGNADGMVAAKTGTALAGNALLAAVPPALRGTVLTRALTGGGINAVTGAAQREVLHQIDPMHEAGPDAQSVLLDALTGGLFGAALGQPRASGSASPTPEPRLQPDAPLPQLVPPLEVSGALPRGADYRGEFTTKPDKTPSPVGTVRVTPVGEAFTPAQGREAFADSLNRSRAGQPTAARINAPVMPVDAAGNVVTSRDYTAGLARRQEVADTEHAAARERTDLGLTPDIERTQAARWEASALASEDARNRMAREPDPEMATQADDDSPPWWMAAQGGEADHAADVARRREDSLRPGGDAISIAFPAPRAELPDASRNLRRFMVDSKAVKPDGAPLTVYHGTGEDFSVFDGERSGAATAHGTSPLGHFFTEHRGQAEHYARNASDGVPAEERVVDAHLSIKNPAEWAMAHLQRIDSPEEARRIRRNLEKSGYDGIHIKDAGQWIAFRPEQIKSASANRGAFDAANPDIRFSARDTGVPSPASANHETFPSGVPKGLPVESTPASERISASINRAREAQGDSGRVQLAEVQPERLPAGLRDSLDQLEVLGDLKVHVVRNLTPDVDDFNGVTTRGGSIFLAENAQHPLTHVAAHEFAHQLSRDRPDLWQSLVEEWHVQGRKAEWAAEAAKRGYRPHEFDEEAVADAVGDAMADPEFLERMAQRNPSAFRKLADAFKAFLDSVLAKLGRIRDLGSQRYWQDVQAFRDKLADVLDRYAQEGRAQQGGSAPMFSRRSSRDVDSDMPSRRPGESQADYLRRVMRKNGDEIKQAVALAKQQRSIGRLEMRAMWAKQARAADVADHAFAEARKLFDKAGDHANLQAIDEWENGRRVTSVEARQFFDNMQQAFDQRIEKIRAIAPDATQQLIDHYFPHIWEDSSKALKWYQAMGAKRPLQGDRSFLKQRTWGTIKDGMASGLKPVSTNPVDLVMLKLGQMDKFIAFNEMRQNLQDRGWLRRMDAGERVPLGYARVDDPAFQIAGGLQGYYAVPELIAKDINNHLSPSLYRNGAWKSLRAVQNVLMSARLGWSMFHAGFTTTDNLVMHADVAARRFMDGDVAGGLSTLLKTPLTVIWSPIEGHKLNREWLGLDKADTHTAAVLDMLEQGGAHRTMSSTEYQNALPKLMRAVRRGALGDSLKQVLPAVGEASSWIIHHWLVPNQKMAARVMLAKFELDRMAGKLGKERGDYAGIIDAMHPDVMKQLGAHVVDAVDDRLGQMNYDNQFWNKTAREAAQAFIGAVGWQVGTVRTVTGGVRDLSHLWSPKQLLAPLDKAGKITDANLGRVSGRLTYLVSLALIMGGLGAVTQYLLTGEGPQEPKDYFFPKTGRKNDDGSDERLQYPSYWMDHYKLATHPLQTAEHKIHPSIGMFMEALANQDYFGVRIRDEDASWWKQATQVGEYVAKGFLPYSWTGHQKLEDAGASRKVANFFGITKAPASVSRTPFQAFVAEKAYAAMPKGSRTPEQAEMTRRKHDFEAAIRRGESPDLSGLQVREQRDVLRAARDEVPAIRFRRLGIEDKLRAWDKATPEERGRYGLGDILMRSHPQRSEAFRRLPAMERRDVLDRLKEIWAEMER